ncbi:hypothetical protein GSI_04511 [Ganoderma sinense ZZ0214-1]|uniref:Aminoglycoside phosphotransferase domain-containing protein n=1 Tax=Ganoderma sinense ZZ0214-1 TaxID=1077348 RepID=A0A2G8SH22_9APHY|nr:hypothetical protein GSI_04511 [Ganoderma sinense ZZ0214-1]
MIVKDTSSVDSLSDEELYALIEDCVHDRDRLVGRVMDPDGVYHTLVWRISPDAVVKLSYGPCEGFTMQFVRDNTSIPVPAVRRVLPVRDSTDGKHWIVMDYVDGNTLFELWDALTDERKRSIFDVLARYVRQLRAVHLPDPSIPGPLHPDGKPAKCSASFFSEFDAGPFGSYQEMADWFDLQRLRCRIHTHRLSGWLIPCSKFDATYPLVLCHMDIHPCNVIIDASGTPWLLDWGAAGAYPPWFEYAAIAVSVLADWQLGTVPAWKDLVANASAIAGDYARYYDEYLSVLFRYTMGINFDDPPCDMDIHDDYFEKLGLEVD